jgi:methyl-accepting chemotaxis protein
MKTRTLALRVVLNSIVMVFLVYLVMQTAVFFRDSLLLQTSDMHDFFPVVFGFIGGRVLPPLILFGVIMYFIALPIQKVQERLEAGEVLTDAEVERTRHRMLGFGTVVLVINLVGFTVGFLLDLVLGNKLAELLQVHRDIILVSNLMGAFVYAAAQTSLNNVVFAPLRDRLGITSIGNRKREVSSSVRQIRLVAALVVYASLVVQYNLHDVARFQGWGRDILAQVQAGSLPADQALPAYRELVGKNLGLVSARDPALAQNLPAPWESGTTQDQQEAVFLLMFALMLVIVIGVQAAVTREQKSWLEALQGRIRDVVAGGGDLRKRLSLRTMDDLGELAELVNSLLDEFQSIVGRIGVAAGQTREGTRAVDQVLARAEAISTQVGAAVVSLQAELEEQTTQVSLLTQALGAFREAASAVDAEAGAQGRFVAETSAAMAEMAAANDLVREKSRQAGALTEALARQGEGGGQAVRETSEAIIGIQHASQEVLQVLGALKKIAADTNLLAMNAAIEAAHAGEKGAGFAVVADEVRKLANTAANQTKAIKDLILAMVRQVESGVERARASGAVLSDLVKGLQDSAQVSRAVVEAMEEQSGRTAGVGEALTQVVGTTASIQTKMTTQDRTTDQMNDSLGRAVEKLSTLIETSQRQAEAVASLEASFAEVRREVDRNAEAAEKLQAEIGRFHV